MHPHQYYFKWFNFCGKLIESRIVSVKFLIGSYHDTANFDIVPMQACSLLFGQPWIYDINVLQCCDTMSFVCFHFQR